MADYQALLDEAREYLNSRDSIRNHPLKNTHVNDIPIIMANFCGDKLRAIAAQPGPRLIAAAHHAVSVLGLEDSIDRLRDALAAQPERALEPPDAARLDKIEPTKRVYPQGGKDRSFAVVWTVSQSYPTSAEAEAATVRTALDLQPGAVPKQP